MYDRANELQLPDCAAYFLNDVMRLGRADYLPTQASVGIRSLHSQLPAFAVVLYFSGPCMSESALKRPL